MLGKITQININKKNGWILNEHEERYSFDFKDFQFQDDITSLTKYDEVRFYARRIESNDVALSIYKVYRIKDIAKKYNVSTEYIIKKARVNGNLTIRNEHSYINIIEMKEIMHSLIDTKDSKMSIKNELTSSCSTISECIEKEYLIFIDTSSLMQYNMLNALNNEVVPYLRKYNRQLYIVDSVLYELNHLSSIKAEKGSTLSKQVQSAQFILSILNQEKLFVVPETNCPTKTFADEELISCFTNYRTKYDLCLVTNDNSMRKNGNLAGSILKLSHDQPINGIKDIKVFSVSKMKDDFKFIPFEASTKSFSEYISPRRVNL